MKLDLYEPRPEVCDHKDAYKPEGWRCNFLCPDCETEIEIIEVEV